MDSVEKHKKIKMKSIFKIPLIIISCLVVAVIGFGVFMYINDGNTYEIYSTIIDKVFNSIVTNLDNGLETIKANGNIILEMSSDNLNAEEQSLMEIINDINIKYDIESSTKDKKTNVNLTAKYKDDDLLTIYGNIIEESTYIKIPTIYDKTIKANEFDAVFVDNKEILTLMEEFKLIIKNNLKEEYFSKEKDVLKINDKDVYVTKHTLEIKAKELFDLEKKIIDDIKDNDKIITVLADIYGIDKNEMINNLNSYRNELEYDEKLNLKVELYINIFTKKVERISFVDEESIIITKNDKNNYVITNDVNEISNIIGNIKIDDNEFVLSVTYDDVKLDYEVLGNDVNVKLGSDGLIIAGNVTNKDGKINVLYELIYEEDGMKFKVSMDGVIEETEEVSDKIINDYVLMDELTDEDYLSIYENLYSNETLMNLVADVFKIYESIYTNENISGIDSSLSTF